MYIKNLRITNFRNCTSTSVEFEKGKNIIYGDNGQGKTNILEAIYYLSFTRSFRTDKDEQTIKFGTDKTLIEGKFVFSNGNDRKVIYELATPNVKTISIDSKRIEKVSEIIGQIPIIILTPDDIKITIGYPEERRKWLDILISQVSRTYLADLIETRKIIKQRNKLLLDGKLNLKKINDDILDSWDEELVKYGIRILEKREKVIQVLKPILKNSISKIQSNTEAEISYVSTFNSENDFRLKLVSQRDLEKKRGLTLTGPHRDDIKFVYNKANLRDYGSQGEHRTFLLALKIAETQYLTEKNGETPILLLDDVFSELDEKRSKSVLDLLENVEQTIITTSTLSHTLLSRYLSNSLHSYPVVSEAKTSSLNVISENGKVNLIEVSNGNAV